MDMELRNAHQVGAWQTYGWHGTTTPCTMQMHARAMHAGCAGTWRRMNVATTRFGGVRERRRSFRSGGNLFGGGFFGRGGGGRGGSDAFFSFLSSRGGIAAGVASAAGLVRAAGVARSALGFGRFFSAGGFGRGGGSRGSGGGVVRGSLQ